MASQCSMTDSVEATQESAERALQMLLRAIAGPNYSGALKQGEVAQQIELCLTWVKAEASEAASLIESCVPHGKPMLAQAQARLESLQALQVLERVTASYFKND